jgi:3-methylfumaryl-CoA hydratase
MWAASDIDLCEPICVGDTLERASSIEAIEHKQGRSGELVFVTLLHEVFRESRLAIRERQRLVYREATTGVSESPTLQAAPAQPQWSRTITPDPVLLFRYSALTFNSHRIHYDRDYATADEGYGGLVVQGPLTAMLLLDSLWREAPVIQLKSFSFRGVRPLLDDSPVRLQGRRGETSAELWALDAGGALAMTVSVTF